MSTTAAPHSIAFDILARHKSAEADHVLMQALECDDEAVQKMAAATIVQRPGQHNILNVIRKVESLRDDACNEFSQSPERFRMALEQAISRSDDETRNAAVTFIRRTGNFEQFATLLDELGSADELRCQSAQTAFVEMASQMVERLRLNDESIFPGLDGVTLRKHRKKILDDLDTRTKQFDDLPKPETVLRLILIIGGPNDEAVRNILTKRGERCRDVAEILMTNDSQPALLDLLSDFLAHHAPPPAAIDVLRTRCDFEFVLHLLKQLPKRPSGYLAYNLARLNDLSWLQDSMAFVERLPTSVHDRLIGAINHIPVDEATRTKVKAWVVRKSDVAGREAATDVLNLLPAEEASEILDEALKDADPEVEAWATHHLRTHKFPETFEELLKRLDENLVIVRDAARDELFSFDLKYLMKIVGALSRGQSLLCGHTLLKINPNAPDELAREISHPFRQRRIHAIEAAEALGFMDKVHSRLIDKLEDPEASVRCTVIEAFGRNPTPDAIKSIRKMTEDSHRQVRSAAEGVISRLSEKLKSAASEIASQA